MSFLHDLPVWAWVFYFVDFICYIPLRLKKGLGGFVSILRIISIFVFLSSFMARPVLALDIEVILPQHGVLPVKVKKMLNHLKEVIPLQVAEVLDHKLILDFSKKAGNLEIKCPKNLINQYSQAVSQEEEEATFKGDYLTSQYVEVPSFVYRWSSYSSQLIWVHEGFLKEAVSRFPSCYKAGNYFSRIDYLEGLLLRSIGKLWNRKTEMQSNFLASKNRLRQFSSSMLFSHLDNWGSGSMVNATKNVWKGDKLKLVAPAVRISPFQNLSLEDSFSVYFEKFLSDKDFACKKPATHMYFKKIMKFSPFGVQECPSLNTKIYGGFLNKNIFNLDPSRIKEIHILLAGPGKAMMSRWGHTMFRLVVCAEGESGKDCISNHFDDIVLGFRAYVGDIQINPIKGVFGKYPSLIFPSSMSDIKNEYNRTELRDLTSIPINFSNEDRKIFLYKALQDFWSYRGKYYFLTNNCATESNDFLMGSFLSSPEKSYLLHEVLGSTLTPTGSISDIKRAQTKPYYKVLSNTFDLTKLNKKNKKLNKSYVSSSYRSALQKIVNLLKPVVPASASRALQKNHEEQLLLNIIKNEKLNIKSFPKFPAQDNRVEVFSDLPIKERARLYTILLKKNPKYAISLTLLEGYIRKGLEKSIKSNSVSLAISVKKPGPLAQKVLEAFKKVTKSHVQVHSFSSYGVPSSEEVDIFLKDLNLKYKLKKSDVTIDYSQFKIKEGADWNWENELIERSEKLAQTLFPKWAKELKEVEVLLKSLKVYGKTGKLSF